MKINTSYIHLKDVRLWGRHGVLPQEQTVGTYFIVNLRVQMNLERAVTTDELSDTVSYADLYQVVREEMAVPSRLLEHVAGRICQRLYQEHAVIQSIDIRIEKENAPIGNGAQALAGITLHTTQG